MAAEHAALIGGRIRAARKAAGMTQRELAEELPGKSDGTQVSKWERGINRPSDQTLDHIARITGHELAWFHSRPVDRSNGTPNLLAELNGHDGVAALTAVLQAQTAAVSEQAGQLSMVVGELAGVELRLGELIDLLTRQETERQERLMMQDSSMASRTIGIVEELTLVVTEQIDGLRQQVLDVAAAPQRRQRG